MKVYRTMMKIEELPCKIVKSNGKTYIKLTSATSINKYTDRILQTDYDVCTIDKITELTTVTNVLTYANGRTEEETYYFIRVDGCLRLVSEQVFKAVDSEFMKNKTIVKGKTIPSDSTFGQDYINMFYVDPEAY